MDADRLHAIILELHDRFNDEDWERVHFYLGTNSQSMVNRSLMGSLFEQDKVNEEHFTFLLNLFEKNQSHNAVKFLKGKFCFHYEPF